MTVNYLKSVIGFIFFLLLQSLILNNVSFFGWGTPFLYIYFLITLPSNLSRNLQLTIGFLMGLGIDIFANTLGVNAFASVVAMTFRPHLLNLFKSRDDQDTFSPSFQSYGTGNFIRYSTTLVILHHFALYTIQLFRLNDASILALKIGASALVTLIIIQLLESLKSTNK
ncbi:MAG: rod shape-determining protein MreD [Bacteroidales bacterium]